MGRVPTIIQGDGKNGASMPAAPQAEGKPAPTRIQIGQIGQVGSENGAGKSDALSPVTAGERPAPTRLQMPAHELPSTLTSPPTQPAQPTRMQPSAAAPVNMQTVVPTLSDAAAKLKPSRLSGVQKRPFTADEKTLRRLVPQAPEALLQLALRQIAAAPLPTAATMSWLRFGEPAQQTLAQLIKQRMQAAEEPVLRQIPVLLRQLHGRMADLLEALQGGVFRRTPAKVWTDAAPEVAFVETRLQQALPLLQARQAQLSDLVRQTYDVHRQLLALDIAAAYLLTQVDAEIQTTLGARSAAILASQALALEQLHLLELDQNSLRDLTALVQDGVLLKLPAVLAQLATMNQRISETQRLLLADVVSELKAFIERKLSS